MSILKRLKDYLDCEKAPFEVLTHVAEFHMATMPPRTDP